MAIIPARTYGVPQVSFRDAAKRPQRTIAFNTAVMRALSDRGHTHVAIDHDSKRREIRFVFLDRGVYVFLDRGVYKGAAAFRLISEGNTGRVLLAQKAQLDAAGIPYGRYLAEIDKREVIVRYGAKR